MTTVAAFGLATLASCTQGNGEAPQAKPERAKIDPVEQAPPADAGQNNFGGTHSNDTTGRSARLKAMREAMNRLRTIPFDSLQMSDPFIYPDPETQTYYLTSSGGRMWKSQDLEMWEGPYEIADLSGTWCQDAGFAAAAEIHKIGDYYYYAATYSDHGEIIQAIPGRYNVPHNQTYLLRSDKVEGPYTTFAVEPGYDYEPYEWDCIDGTL